MKGTAIRCSFLTCVVFLVWPYASFAASEHGNFSAGAARVEITPAPDALPAPFKTVLDPIYVRAVVLDNGITTAAMVGADARGFGDDMWGEVSARIAQESGIKPENLIVWGTHSHSTPETVLGQKPAGSFPVYEDDAKKLGYRASLLNAVVESVRQAKARLQPARVGYGRGAAYLNVNRDWYNPADQHWYLYQPYQGVNTNMPSDKTVYVLRFDALNGEPIAIYCNYAVHSVFNNGGTGNEISGDVAGVTSRYVEGHYGGKVVALWAPGAEGDQHPIYKVWIDRPGPPTEEELRGSHHMMTIAGEMLGEEVIFTAGQVKDFSQNVRLFGAQRKLTCPGQRVTPRNHPLMCAYPGWPGDSSKLPPCGSYRVEDAPPASIRISLLMIDRIAIAGIGGEPVSILGAHLQAASPFANTIVGALINGRSGYVPADISYDAWTYETTSTTFKRGCAEQSIVNGFLEMMKQY